MYEIYPCYCMNHTIIIEFFSMLCSIQLYMYMMICLSSLLFIFSSWLYEQSCYEHSCNVFLSSLMFLWYIFRSEISWSLDSLCLVENFLIIFISTFLFDVIFIYTLDNSRMDIGKHVPHRGNFVDFFLINFIV